MNNEDFVTYDIAQTLKEAGFDWACCHYYTKENAADDYVWITTSTFTPEDWNDGRNIGPVFLKPLCSAPTLAKAQKWLREVHGIHIAVIGNYDCGGNFYAFEIWLQGVPGGRQVLQYETKKLSDYEFALSAGIEAALKLINNEINNETETNTK